MAMHAKLAADGQGRNHGHACKAGCRV